jgi:hypothetical protein
MSGAKNSFWTGCRNWLKDGLEIKGGEGIEVRSSSDPNDVYWEPETAACLL